MSAYRVGPRASEEELVRAAGGLVEVTTRDARVLLRWRWLDRGIAIPLGVAALGVFVYFQLGRPLNPFTLVSAGFVVYGTYVGLARLLNRTDVAVDFDASTLTVRHVPIPWPDGRRDFALRDLESLYVEEEISRGVRGKSATTYSYQVRANVRGSGDVMLVNGPLDPARAKAVVVTLARCLGLPDGR